MLKNKSKYIFPILLLLGILSVTTAQNTPTSNRDINIKVSLDSVYIEMGRVTPLHIEIVGTLSETGGILLPDTLWRDVEIAGQNEPEITDLGNGRKELKQDIILQAFDSGLYTLPPVLYVQDDQVYESNRPALKVVPTDIDSLSTINDYYDAQEPDSHFFDFLPDFITDYGLWIILAVLLILISVYIYFKWIREGRIPLMPAKKPIPPYELAMSRLDSLKGEKLCERGEEKEFYTRLVDILRSYMDARFGINAMEMTSSQILLALKENETTKLPEKYISQILEVADFVKFAKVRPLPEDNIASFKSAVQFVEDTRPVENLTDSENEMTAKEVKTNNNNQ